MQLFWKRNLKHSLNLTKISPYGDGAFSTYFNLNGTLGAKVMYCRGFTSIKRLRKSRIWRVTTAENTLLRKSRKRYSLIPHTYGVQPVKISNRYFPAIIMEHIEGKVLWKYTKSEKEYSRIRHHLERKLEQQGIFHSDLHEGNIIVQKDGDSIIYYIIDFTPECVFICDGYE